MTYRPTERRPARSGLLTLALMLSAPVSAQESPAIQRQDAGAKPHADLSDPSAAAEQSGEGGWMFDLRTSKTLTGDWGGARTALSDAGVKIDIKLMNELMVNMHGGLESKNGHDAAGSYEINLVFDFDRMGWIKGGSLFFQVEGDWGGEASDFDREKIGGLSRTNHDAGEEEPVYVDKWWWTQELFEGRLELRFGRLEPHKSMLDVSLIMNDEDSMFMNQSLTINRTFPAIKGLGLYARWKVTDAFYLKAAVIDAQSRSRQTNFNTAFHDERLFRVHAETGLTPKLPSSNGDLPGNYRLGTWFDPRVKVRNDYPLRADSRLSPKTDANDWGLYLGLDQMVWRESDDTDQGLTLGGRYGWSDGEVNRIEHFWAMAVQYKGLIDGRDRDVLAFGVAQAVVADELRRTNPFADRETVYELYYSVEVCPWLIVTPDFQFVTNAGGDKNDRNAPVFGLRVKMKL